MTWQVRYSEEKHYWIGRFEAMACPCTVFIDTQSHTKAHDITRLAYSEAKRIEQKFSRYRDDNILYKINHAHGQPVHIDQETHRLLTFADTCYDLSDGMFDVTSGILGKLWTFKSQTTPPNQQSIEQLSRQIGWHKVRLDSNSIQLPPGYTIDLGGIGKEYAVDYTINKLQLDKSEAVLINFGGDIAVSGARNKNQPWDILLENPGNPNKPAHIQLARGAIATSGDSKRSFIYQGKRFGHILNAKTGWPVSNAPRSATVVADNCIEAGMLATFAILQGEQARKFLEQQDVNYICFD